MEVSDLPFNMEKKYNTLCGEVLRKKRVIAGISQENLAMHCGVTFQQIQKYEKGINRISIGKLHAMCDKIGISKGSFLNEVDRIFFGVMPEYEGEEDISLKSLLKLNRSFQNIKSKEMRDSIINLVSLCSE